jgi:hypothetical protein
MWYNFKAHAKLSDEAFAEMMDEEIKQGKDPLRLAATARTNGWQHKPDRQPANKREASKRA